MLEGRYRLGFRLSSDALSQGFRFFFPPLVINVCSGILYLLASDRPVCGAGSVVRRLVVASAKHRRDISPGCGCDSDGASGQVGTADW